jgi:hypothetical protein
MNDTIDMDTLDTSDGAEAYELLCSPAVLDPEVIDEARNPANWPGHFYAHPPDPPDLAATHVIDQVRRNVAHGCGQVTGRTYTALRGHLRTVTFADLR